jgi:hypothetical protein
MLLCSSSSSSRRRVYYRIRHRGICYSSKAAVFDLAYGAVEDCSW